MNKASDSHNSRIEWLDTLRILTMILVVIGHAIYTPFGTKYGGYYVKVPLNACHGITILNYLIQLLYQFHMPVFIALAGACFSLGYKKMGTYKSLLLNKTKRLIIPFVITTTLVSVPIKYLSGYFCESTHIFKDIIYGQYLLLGNSHLWFLISLFLCFTVFPLLEPLHRKLKALFWVFLILLYWFSPRIGYLISDGFGLYGMAHYLIYFAAGFYGLRYIQQIKTKKGYWLIGSTVTLFTFYNITINNIHLSVNPLLYLISGFSGCIAMCMLCRIITGTKTWATIVNKPLRWFRDYNYEIYLYSDPWNYLILAIVLNCPTFDYFHYSLHVLLVFIARILLTTTLAVGVAKLFMKLKISSLYK